MVEEELDNAGVARLDGRQKFLIELLRKGAGAVLVEDGGNFLNILKTGVLLVSSQVVFELISGWFSLRPF